MLHFIPKGRVAGSAGANSPDRCVWDGCERSPHTIHSPKGNKRQLLRRRCESAGTSPHAAVCALAALPPSHVQATTMAPITTALAALAAAVAAVIGAADAAEHELKVKWM